MGVLLPAILLVLCGVTTVAAQGASPGAPLGTREAQAAIRAGRNASLEPTPRLPDGTPNLGRVGTEKGIWGLPGILNFAQMAIDGPEKADPRLSGPETGGAVKEPWIPFQPWSAAVYNYNSMNDSKYDPEGSCVPRRSPRLRGPRCP